MLGTTTTKPTIQAQTTRPHPNRQYTRVLLLTQRSHTDLTTHVARLRSIHLAPLLLHNLAPLSTGDSSHPTKLVILPAPFSAALLRPPLPTASSVTLARLASPASTNKLLQAQVVRALRTYFEGTRRILKVGDVFGVGVSEFDLNEEGEEGGPEDEGA